MNKAISTFLTLFILLSANVFSQTVVNMPYNGQTNVTATCGTIYDPGGENGNYNSGASGYVKLDIPAGVKLTIHSVDIDGDCSSPWNDYLKIYNGPNTTYPLLATVANGCTPTLPYTVTSTGAMILHFYSYNSAAGFVATWTTGNPPVAGSVSGPNSVCLNSTANLSVSGYTSGSTLQWESSSVFGGPYLPIAGATSANYTTEPFTTAKYYRVKVTKNCQTSATAAKHITIVSGTNPTTSVSPTSASICSGSNVTLTASGANSYTWLPTTGLSSASIANPVASPTVTTTYTVTGTTTNGCSKTATSIVTVNPLPSVSINPNHTSVVIGDSTLIEASGANTYTWSPTNGLSNTNIANPMVSPDTTITYIVTGTDNYGCTNTASVLVDVMPVPRCGAGESPLDTTTRAPNCGWDPYGASKYAQNATFAPTTIYTPPIKTIRLSFHFFEDKSMPNNNSNWDNFDNPNSTTPARLNQIITWMNDRMQNLVDYKHTNPAFGNYNNFPNPLLNSTVYKSDEASIRYEIDGIYFYDNPYLNTLITNGPNGNAYESFMNANFPSRIEKTIPIYVTAGKLSTDPNYQALGFADFPSFNNFNKPAFVVTFSLLNSNTLGADWVFRGHLLHELGHDFDMRHTYNDGNIDRQISNVNYLSDVYETTFINHCNQGIPYTHACPHDEGFNGDTNSTNNIMGSTKWVEHYSALQLGKIHKMFSLSSVRKYVKPMLSSTNNWVVNSNETWDFDIQMYQDILVTNNSTLTITCRTAMANNGKITVQAGSTLIIDEGIVTAWGDMLWYGIILEPGSNLVVDNGTIENALFAVASVGGAHFTIENNSVLNKNYYGISILPYSGTHTGIIKNSKITCLDASGNPVNLSLSPVAGQKPFAGILIADVDNIQIGVDAAGETNTFDNLQHGIVSNNSNLTVFNNIFNRINISTGNSYGVYSANNTTSQFSEKYLIAGGNANIYQKNTFTNSKTGIYVTVNQDVILRNNEFNNLTTAVEINNVRTSVNDIVITGNKMDDCLTAINVYGIAGSQNLIVDDNDVNLAAPTANSNANSKAFVITSPLQTTYHPVTQNPMPVVTIANNNIKRVTTGIELTNFIESTINDNIISDISDLGISVFSNGILINTSPGSTIRDNNISAANGQNSYYMNGIRVESCNDIKVYRNLTENIGAGLFFGGANQLSEIAKNQMKNNYWGFVLNYGETGPQYGDNRASENSWEGTFSGSNLFSYYSDGSLSPWKLYTPSLNPVQYCNPASGLCMNPDPQYFVNDENPGIAPYSIIPVSQSTVVSGRSMSAMQIADMVKTAKGKKQYPIYNESAQWMAKQGVYHLLKKDSLLKNEDPYLQIFADSVALTNMGKLRNINNQLVGENCDYAKAAIVLNSLGKTNDVEKKLVEVYEMMIESNDTAYTPNQIHKLQKIAALCPYEFGSGVYSARAILSKFDSVTYFNECEMPTGGKNKAITFAETEKQNVYVYPNPANDKLSILINGETGQVAYFELFDLTGKLIASKQLTANTVNEISTAEIVSGLYFYSIKANNVLIDSGKLSIIR